MRILFMGTPHFARVILESLCEDSRFCVIGLVTQEDKPFGRKKELKMPPCKEFALSKNIPILQPRALCDILGDLSALNIDAIIVAAYGKILPKEIIKNYFCINVHASILPKLRGASPIQEMILQDLNFVGASIIKMDEKLDSGDILALAFLENQNLDIEILSQILAQNSARILKKVLQNVNLIAPLPQIHADSSYCKKIKKSDGEIDFSDAKRVHLAHLAYKNWPNIFLKNGTKLFGIEICDLDSRNRAGEIVKICESGAIIGCKKGSILVREIQEASKNKMNIASYLRGKRLKVGDILE